MIDIPQAVLDAFWALLIALIGWAMAYIQTVKKNEAVAGQVAAEAETTKVIDFYDPKTGNTPVPAKVPGRSYLMNDETKRYLTNGMNAEDAAKALKQVAEAEAAGKTDYYIFWSEGYYHVEFGLLSGSGRGSFEPATKAVSV